MTYLCSCSPLVIEVITGPLKLCQEQWQGLDILATGGWYLGT